MQAGVEFGDTPNGAGVAVTPNRERVGDIPNRGRIMGVQCSTQPVFTCLGQKADPEASCFCDSLISNIQVVAHSQNQLKWKVGWKDNLQ